MGIPSPARWRKTLPRPPREHRTSPWRGTDPNPEPPHLLTLKNLAPHSKLAF